MKNEQLQVLNYRENEIRMVELNGEPWWVAKDVCVVLGISKYRDAVSGLDDDERVSVSVDTLGGPQTMSAVNESGLYNLIFQSHKPEAKKFKRWVTHEVLPSLRRRGFYLAAGDGREAKEVMALRLKLRAAELRCEAAELERQSDAVWQIEGGESVVGWLVARGCLLKGLKMASLCSAVRVALEKMGAPIGKQRKGRDWVMIARSTDIGAAFERVSVSRAMRGQVLELPLGAA